MIASKWIFKFFDRLKMFGLLFILFVSWVGTAIVLKTISSNFLNNHMLFYNAFLSIFMLPSFMLGYMANKFSWVCKVQSFNFINICKNFSPLVMLILISILMCCISHQTIGIFYAAAFILLFAQLPVNKHIGTVLSYLGKHSMNIWLIHTWFCTHLFHDFFYDTLYYPIIMYFTLLMMSLIVSHIVDWIYKSLCSDFHFLMCK